MPLDELGKPFPVELVTVEHAVFAVRLSRELVLDRVPMITQAAQEGRVDRDAGRLHRGHRNPVRAPIERMHQSVWAGKNAGQHAHEKLGEAVDVALAGIHGSRASSSRVNGGPAFMRS